MNLRILGLCAMLGAPFLLIDFLVNGIGEAHHKTAFSGLFSLLYISGWMCSIIGLWRMEATGTNRWGRIVLLIQLLFLSLANVSNIMMLLQTGIQSRLFFVLDLFWPVSNIWMLVSGITVLTARRLRGWMQFVPIVVASWLPVSIFLFSIILGGTRQGMLLSGAYSAAAWMLLGYVVYMRGENPRISKAYALS